MTDNYENVVLVSYAWGGESERIVDELERAFAARGIRILRDKKDIDYKDSIVAFEQRIGRGQCIVLVISDKYLRSEHCMYELVEVDKNRNLRDRIFPIVLPEAQIYKAFNRLNYIQHWDKEIEQLNQAIKEVKVVANLAGITAALDKYTSIRASFDHLIDLLSDMNAQTPEILAANDFSTLIGTVERVMHRTKQVELILKGEFNKFTPDRQQEIVGVLAVLLGVNRNDIQVLKVREGSIVIDIEIPDIALDHLYEMATTRDFRIISLGIISVLVEGREVIKPADNRLEQLQKNNKNRNTQRTRNSASKGANMTENNQQIPLARVFQLKELPGRIGKSIQVPPGRLGIALYTDGKTRTFPPGEQRLLSLLERFQGKGIGLQCGYIPTGPLTACLRLEYLLSGDGELLDALLVCAIEISDPARFFREIVVPRGELRDATLELDPSLVQAALGAVTAQYTASDLASGRLDARLLPQAAASLGGLLGNLGLTLKEIQLLSVSRSENRVVVAEKAQALRERLQDVDLQRKLAEIETQSQLDEFIQHAAPEMKDVAHTSLAGSAPAQKGGVAETLRSWLASAGGQAQRTRSWLEKLFQQKQKEEEFTMDIPKSPPRTRTFWEKPTWGILLTLLLAILLTSLVPILPNGLSKIDILIAVWGAALPLLIERSFALIKLREEFEEQNWAQRGHQYLDNLTGNDRQWADQVVREQCVRELRHIREIVSEIRGSEYQRGNQGFALTLKQTLERNLEEWLAKVQRSDYAKPPYVTDLNISQHAWKQMLDQDEDLVLHINALSEWAGHLQQESLLAQLTPEAAAKLNAEISKFGNLFFERGRSMQAPAAEPTKK